MANSNGWGDGASNNDIGWGQGADNAIGWGSIYTNSWAGATDIVGVTSTPFTNQYSMSLDGVDEYAKGSSTFSELDGGNKFTLSMWVKPTSFAVSRMLFHIPRNTTAGSSQLLMRLNTDGNPELSIDTGSYYIRTSTPITLDVWNHILVCVDLTNPINSQKGRIYINSVDATSSVNISSRTAFSTSTGAVWLGEEANGYLNPFLGNMDEVAMWVGSDERANVADIYNSGVPSDLSQLATPPSHWWRMGDGSTYYNMVNGFLNSENINGWVRTALNTTGTPPYLNVETAPDGLMTADKIIEDTSTGAHYIRHTVSITTGVDYNISCYLKAGERTKVYIRTNIDGNGLSHCDLDLTTGVISNNTFPNDIIVTNVGNGWWRFSTYTTALNSGSNSALYVHLFNNLDQITYTGDNISGCYIWGLQISTSQEVLPYFKTEGIITYFNDWILLDNGSGNNNLVSINMEEADRVTDVP